MSILTPRLADAEVLDLFAGVGNVGIETLSRGAAHATFVELGSGPVRDIRENLRRAHLAARGTVVQQDVFAFLTRPPRPADVLFYGPPQWLGLWERATRALDAQPAWIAHDGVAVLQCDPSEYRQLDLSALEEVDQRRYGGVLLTFFERR